MFDIRQENGKFCSAQCAVNSVNEIVQLKSFDLKGVLSRNHRKKNIVFWLKTFKQSLLYCKLHPAFLFVFVFIDSSIYKKHAFYKLN